VKQKQLTPSKKLYIVPNFKIPEFDHFKMQAGLPSAESWTNIAHVPSITGFMDQIAKIRVLLKFFIKERFLIMYGYEGYDAAVRGNPKIIHVGRACIK